MTVLQCFREEAEYCYGRELEEGLLYLNDFAPTVRGKKFEETVKKPVPDQVACGTGRLGHG